jgi:hypothetical protein
MRHGMTLRMGSGKPLAEPGASKRFRIPERTYPAAGMAVLPSADTVMHNEREV